MVSIDLYVLCLGWDSVTVGTTQLLPVLGFGKSWPFLPSGGNKLSLLRARFKGEDWQFRGMLRKDMIVNRKQIWEKFHS